MFGRKELVPVRSTADPFALLRRMTGELDRAFDDPFFEAFRRPVFRGVQTPDLVEWAPKVDVFEKENRLFARVDLPGVKKDDVKVEVIENHLILSGERKVEKEETKDNVYRSEREYGSFYRAVPLPEGVTLDDVKATFANGVLEVSVPLPTRVEPKVRKVEIQEPVTAAKTAA
jgi:HSP20 family protein